MSAVIYGLYGLTNTASYKACSSIGGQHSTADKQQWRFQNSPSTHQGVQYRQFIATIRVQLNFFLPFEITLRIKKKSSTLLFIFFNPFYLVFNHKKTIIKIRKLVKCAKLKGCWCNISQKKLKQKKKV